MAVGAEGHTIGKADSWPEAPELPTGGHVPELHGMSAGGREGAAIGAERHAMLRHDHLVRLPEGAEHPARGDVMECHGIVTAGGGQGAAVRTIYHT